MPNLIPLFPLDLVLLPGAPVQLHIFEPRYKEMIAECLQQGKAFGIVRAKEQEVAGLGCTAEIVKVLKQYDDGRMDILAAGRQRFEVVTVNQERPFLQAEILPLLDEPGRAEAQAVTRATTLYEEIAGLTGAGAGGGEESDEVPLSFRLAASLPLDLDFKQSLLGMKSEAERIPALVSVFEAILPSLRRTVRARLKAGGNGHAG